MDAGLIFVIIVALAIVGGFFYFKKHGDQLAALEAKAKALEEEVKAKLDTVTKGKL